MYIGVPAFFAAPIASLSNALPGRFIAAVKLQLVHQLLARPKELGLFSLFKKLLMFLITISEQHTAAGRDLERASGVLVGADLAQETKTDVGTR